MCRATSITSSTFVKNSAKLAREATIILWAKTTRGALKISDLNWKNQTTGTYYNNILYTLLS